MIKGLIFDIRRFAVHDGPGIRTIVFFKGCPLHCWWCHNPEGRLPVPEHSIRHLSLNGRIFEQEEVTGTLMTVQEVIEEVVKDRIFFDESGGGVTLSGGEPLFQPEFLHSLLKELKRHDLHITLDTCGYAQHQDLEQIMNFVDLFLYDLKHPDDDEHIKYTGVSIMPILENLRFLISSGIKVVLRLPIIPGINDQSHHIQSLINILDSCIPAFPHSSIDISLLPYHILANKKYQRFNIENRMKGTKSIVKSDLLTIKSSLEKGGYCVKIGF